MTHRTKILSPSQTVHVPTCTCGYVGDDYPNRSAAAADAARHELEALRAGTIKTPKK